MKPALEMGFASEHARDVRVVLERGDSIDGKDR